MFLVRVLRIMNEIILNAVKVLREGGVVAHPTETCYGLAVDIFSQKAVRKLYRFKKMPFDKPVSILVRDIKDAQDYGEFSPLAIRFALKYWPGPLTIIVPRKKIVPSWINPGTATIGIRVSSNKKTRQLVEAFGAAITTTSANISTQMQAYSVQEFLEQRLVPDFIIDSGKLSENIPSTIVEIIGEQVKIIRKGGVSLHHEI